MCIKKIAAILWYRRDLRTQDNPALLHAAKHGLPVVPVYFLSNWQGSHEWTGPKRQHFLCGCLEALARDLDSLGSRLIIRQEEVVTGLRQLIRESCAVAVHFNADPAPNGKILEDRVRLLCAELGVDCHAHDNATLHRPDSVLTRNSQPYRVFTPYSRTWLELPKPEPLGCPARLTTPAHLKSLPLPTLQNWDWQLPVAQLPEPGEGAARKRLRRTITEIIPAYGDKRDYPAIDGTSRISQDLRFGLLSIRTVYAEVIKARSVAKPAERANIDIFIKELIWREFYFSILHHFPHVIDEEFNPDWRGLPWAGQCPLSSAWKNGLTGFPIVDAGMRELLATGHMHNRLRMVTAMFLTKDLHIDWKLGESHFMQHLVDGEVASNNGGWQWSAGTGADAAPYFRIQNPWSQSARYDPDGIYIRRWIPELAEVEPSRFTRPPDDGKPLAPDYPLPCIDHKTERARTLTIFKRHRAQISHM